jgi:hypothetical protein
MCLSYHLDLRPVWASERTIYYYPKNKCEVMEAAGFGESFRLRVNILPPPSAYDLPSLFWMTPPWSVPFPVSRILSAHPLAVDRGCPIFLAEANHQGLSSLITSDRLACCVGPAKVSPILVLRAEQMTLWSVTVPGVRAFESRRFGELTPAPLNSIF